MVTRNRTWMLSGGIGSGKSEVGRLLSAAGIEVIDADSIGHRVLEPNGVAFARVAERWPGVVVGGRIDRKALGKIVFTDRAQLGELEALTHPAIFAEIEHRVQASTHPVVVEIPLLRPEIHGQWKRIVVDAPEEIRRQRLVDAGLSNEEITDRMSVQPSREEWLAAADIVLPNTGTIEELRQVVPRLIALLA